MMPAPKSHSQTHPYRAASQSMRTATTAAPSLHARSPERPSHSRRGVERINLKSTSFPKNFIVYGDTVMKTEDDALLPYKLTAYKVAPQSNLSLSFSNNGDPGSITITADLLADEDDNILDLILIEE